MAASSNRGNAARIDERRQMLGHDFSYKELQSVDDDLKDPTPWLNDMSVLFLASTMRVSRKMPAEERDRIDIVNPIFQSMLLADDKAVRIGANLINQDESRYHRAVEYYREAIGEHRNHYKFVPLHCHSHWSLLYYDPSTSRWYHYDSLRPYHTEYAVSFMLFLSENRIIPNSEAIDAIMAIQRAPNAPYLAWLPTMQVGGWECGFFTLMFIFAIVNNNMTPIDSRSSSMCTPSFLGTFRGYCTRYLKILVAHMDAD